MQFRKVIQILKYNLWFTLIISTRRTSIWNVTKTTKQMEYYITQVAIKFSWGVIFKFSVYA